jgi:hypothetical protein
VLVEYGDVVIGASTAQYVPGAGVHPAPSAVAVITVVSRVVLAVLEPPRKTDAFPLPENENE